MSEPSPVVSAQRWVLAVMALFPERRDPDGSFSSIVTRPLGSAQALNALAADGLVDADDVRRELLLLMAAARSSEPIYNLARASLIAARAHTAYLIPLEEAWATATECARALQQHCRGWFSMAEACLTGLTTHEGEATGRVAREAFYALHARPDSPWNLVPWKTELPRVLPPPEVVTERIHVADSAALTAALACARPGQTLTLAPNRYTGPFHVTTAGLTLLGGPEVFLVPATDAAPEPLITLLAPSALHGLTLRPQPGSTAIHAHTPFLALDECSIEGGERAVVFAGSFLQIRDTNILGAQVGLTVNAGAASLSAVTFDGCRVAIEQGHAMNGLTIRGSEARGCGATFACARRPTQRFARPGAESQGEAASTPVIRLHRFISNSGILDFRDDGKISLVECRLDGGFRVGGGEFLAERCQFSASSRIDFTIATLRECHFLGAAEDNLTLGEGHFTTLVGGQLAGAEGADAANLRILGGTVRLEGVGLGPSAGHNLYVASSLAGLRTGESHRTGARVELVDVVMSSAGKDAMRIDGEHDEVLVKTKTLRIRGAGTNAVFARRARLELVGLDVADAAQGALQAHDCHIEIVGFGLRGVRFGMRVHSSTLMARDLVATSIEGRLIEVSGGRAAITASDILLSGHAGLGAILAVARAHVPAHGLAVVSAECELDRCRLAKGALTLVDARLSLKRCEVEPDAVTTDALSSVATDPAPSHATAISPLLVALKPEPFQAWGVAPDIARLLAVARLLARRLGYLERLGLREMPQGLRIDGPLPVVARFAPALSALLASPASLGLALSELLEP